MSTREDAHRLVDAVPDGQVDMVVEWLRQAAAIQGPPIPRRRFRTNGVFDGEPDLGARTKDILRRELGGKDTKSA
jgi:hypothetical protein